MEVEEKRVKDKERNSCIILWEMNSLPAMEIKIKETEERSPGINRINKEKEKSRSRKKIMTNKKENKPLSTAPNYKWRKTEKEFSKRKRKTRSCNSSENSLSQKWNLKKNRLLKTEI